MHLFYLRYFYPTIPLRLASKLKKKLMAKITMKAKNITSQLPIKPKPIINSNKKEITKIHENVELKVKHFQPPLISMEEVKIMLKA